MVPMQHSWAVIPQHPHLHFHMHRMLLMWKCPNLSKFRYSLVTTLRTAMSLVWVVKAHFLQLAIKTEMTYLCRACSGSRLTPYRLHPTLPTLLVARPSESLCTLQEESSTFVRFHQEGVHLLTNNMKPTGLVTRASNASSFAQTCSETTSLTPLRMQWSPFGIPINLLFKGPTQSAPVLACANHCLSDEPSISCILFQFSLFGLVALCILCMQFALYNWLHALSV